MAITVIRSIYVNGVKKYLERPEVICALVKDIPSKWVAARLCDEPNGPVVAEHTVPRELFDTDYRGRWRTGGNWYSQFPDSAFEPPAVAA